MKDKLAILLAEYRNLHDSYDGWPETINSEKPEGDRPVNVAAYRGKIKEMEIFLENGSDIDNLGADGYTPLHCAVEFEQLDMVKYLVERGADTKRANSDGSTPLELALNLKHREISDYLLNLDDSS